MKERKNRIIICMLTAVVSVILSLGCGLFASIAGTGRGLGSDLGEMLRRVQAGTTAYIIMIDPGHGGMDGGASSSDGTLEKDINLAIAKKMATAAEQYDCRVMLTREKDQWLCETEEGSIRSRKTADLAARRELIRKYKPDVVVSIHLNSFKEDASVSGAQVFYPPGDAVWQETGEPDDAYMQSHQMSSQQPENALMQSRLLAETMQKKINEALQPDTPRTAMTRDGVFIFKEVEQPVIIIECGFMSNPDEAAKLKTDKYQQELAACIMSGIADFAGLKKPVNVEIIDSSK